MPSRGGGDDFVRVCGSDEWFWLLILIGDEAVDGGLEIDDAFEDAAFEAAFGQDGEEALDGIEPTRRGGREVKRPSRIAAQAVDHLGVYVGGVVVEDRADSLGVPDLTLRPLSQPAGAMSN